MLRKAIFNWPRLFLAVCALWLTGVFLFNPHYVELTQVLDNWFTTKGLILYKDVAEFHFPLGRWMFLPLHLLTNWNLKFDPFIGLATGISTLITIYFFGKRFLSPLGTTVALIFFSIFFWYFATNISFFHEMLNGFIHVGVILILFVVWKTKTVSSTKLFLFGLFLSLSELVGQLATLNIIAEFLLMILILWKKLAKYKGRNAKQLVIKPIFFLFLGIIIPVLVVSFYFVINGAFYEFFRWNVLYYFSNYVNHPKGDLLSLPHTELFALYVPLFVIGICIVRNIVKRKEPNFNYFTIFFLAFSTIPFSLFSIFHFHHLNFALPILSLTAGFAFDYTRGSQKYLFLLGTGLVLFSFVSIIIPWHTQRIIYPSLKIYNDAQPGDAMYQAADWIKKNTSPQTKIFVVADPLFYFTSDRLPPSRPSKGIPYGWEPFEEVKSEIKAQPAEYWITSEGLLNRLRNEYNQKYMAEFVEEELASCYKNLVEYGDWKIWGRVCKP